MHILYMHTHDTGRYIEPYGYGIPSPNLMALAREGTLFRHAYCTAPTCSASRSSLLTGMSPHNNGMLGLAHRGFALHDYTQHLAQYIGTHRYETVLCGVQHEAQDETLLGYERTLHRKRGAGTSGGQWDLDNAHKAAEYLREFAKEPGERLFFLSFGMSSTHREFPKEHHVSPHYVMPPFPMYDCAANRADAAAYVASVTEMDRCVGIVMDALRVTGLDDQTLVIFTTDHGIAFPHMKCSLYDTGIGVSLILRYPGNPLAGTASDALVSHLDLFPTVCDFAGIPKPDWLQGFSLLPLLEGRCSRIREELHAELNFHAAREPLRCIRTDRYKLIRRYEETTTVLPSNIDDSPSKSFLLDAGFLTRPPAREMLFDLYLDPVERVNLIGEEAYAEVRSDLVERLERWMRETDDPLLREGGLEAPEGARVNAKRTLSPRDREYET